MSVLPTIDCWERHSKLSRKPFLCQPQSLPKFPNQLTDFWLFNTKVVLMEKHTAQRL